MLDKNQPIIIKKIKKVSGGHHGGAWKIAYADFVTAMMAFFLLMWLLAITDEEQQRAIADYFQNPTAVTGGQAGANSALINMGSAVKLSPGAFGKMQDPSPSIEANSTAASPVPTDSDVERRMEQIEQKRLNDLKKELEMAISKDSQLATYRDQLLIEMTNDGLRISVTDKKNRPMFDLGSSYLKWYMSGILKEIAKLINSVPNKISIAGHTDARKYYSDSGYTNWELSADRANASRRQLISSGLKPEKVVRVVGLASMALHNKKDPYHAANRRITITVLKKKAEEAISKESEAIDYKDVSNYISKSKAAASDGGQYNMPDLIGMPRITPEMVETPAP